ncbi:MAG: hypothetical protein WCU88_01945 [Elusimicrobiota bacterium]|jgi:hypothetical protein
MQIERFSPINALKNEEPDSPEPAPPPPPSSTPPDFPKTGIFRLREKPASAPQPKSALPEKRESPSDKEKHPLPPKHDPPARPAPVPARAAQTPHRTQAGAQENYTKMRATMRRHAQAATVVAKAAVGKVKERPVTSTLAGVFLLLLGLMLQGAIHLRRNSDPKLQILRSASRYLQALQTGDVEKAYGLLSAESNRKMSLEEFRLLLPPAMEPGTLEIEMQEPDWALVRCAFQGQDGQIQERMSFQLEDGRWTRPYDWGLLAKAEAALSAGDAAAASQAAAQAAAVDPRDPLASAYACEAAYMRQDAQGALAACRSTVELAKKYPSQLNSANLFHLHAVLADLYKNSLNQPGEAVREYGILLSLPELGSAERCDIQLARADARVLQNDLAGALADYRSAANTCPPGEDASYARNTVGIFSGSAGAHAVFLAQNTLMPGEETTLLQWRKQVLRELRARMRERGSRMELSPDVWAPEYLSGADYLVRLRGAGMDVLAAHVDLWSQTVKVDFHDR